MCIFVTHGTRVDPMIHGRITSSFVMPTWEASGEGLDSEGEKWDSTTPGPSAMSTDSQKLQTTPDVQEAQDPEPKYPALPMPCWQPYHPCQPVTKDRIADNNNWRKEAPGWHPGGCPFRIRISVACSSWSTEKGSGLHYKTASRLVRATC